MKQLIQIVDDQDKVIGHKERTKLDYRHDVYRVAALWLTNSKNEVLLAQRKKNKDKDPGVWGPAVAGTLEQGESYSSNIYKEAKEEIGLTGVKLFKGPKMYVTQPRRYFGQWFLAQIDKPINSFIIQEKEVEAIKWVSIDWLIGDVAANSKKYTAAFPQTLEIMKMRQKK